MILKREAISEISMEKKTSRKSSLSNTLRFWQNSIWRSISFPEIERLSYQNVLDTHKTLFKDVYPWAGQDRAQTAPNIAVSKGTVLFAHPDDAKPAVEHALRMGQDRKLMADRLGEVMGYLAYGHPFLGGMAGQFWPCTSNLPNARVSASIGRQPTRQLISPLDARVEQSRQGTP